MVDFATLFSRPLSLKVVAQAQALHSALSNQVFSITIYEKCKKLLDKCIQNVYTYFRGRWLVRIEELEIEDHILDKIESVHGVSVREIEEACLSDSCHIRKGREGLYKVFSQTEAGRYILAVLVDAGKGRWRVATARSMTNSERRLYKKEIGGN